MIRRTLARAAVVACVVVGCVATLPAQQVQESQDEFVALDELTAGDLPPEERLAAAPLLIGAYAFVLVALFTYVTLVARRLTGLQRDIARLEATIGRDGTG